MSEKISPELPDRSNLPNSLNPSVMDGLGTPPPGFRERYGRLTDLEPFLTSITAPPRKSLRVNTLRSTIEEVRELLESQHRLEPIPWCPEGFHICDHTGLQHNFGSLPGHSAGLFYIQEAASMLPVRILDPRPGELVLDLCAAPGGKTTQMAQYMANRGRIWATDAKKKRLNALRRNLRRMGVTNVTLKQDSDWELQRRSFDRVLIDAPCSGTGTMRNWLWQARELPAGDHIPDETIKLEGLVHWYLGNLWGRDHFRYRARIQSELLRRAYRLVRKGGVMVYSTCSLEPEENESVVDRFLQRHPGARIENIDRTRLPGLIPSRPISEWNGRSYHEDIARTLRVMPQDNHTDGFFMALIRKPG